MNLQTDLAVLCGQSWSYVRPVGREREQGPRALGKVGFSELLIEFPRKEGRGPKTLGTPSLGPGDGKPLVILQPDCSMLSLR